MPVASGLYSRIVAVLKVGLPLVALGLLAGLFLVRTEDELAGSLMFSDADLAALTSGMQVSNATFSGTTDQGDAFRFNTREVIPDAAPPTRAAIAGLEGSLVFEGGNSMTLSATQGDLDISGQRLSLTGDVTVATADGYAVRSPHMEINLREGLVEAENPVLAEGPAGNIRARALRIARTAEDPDLHIATFTGAVRAVLQPE